MHPRDPRLNRFPQLYVVEASAGSGKTYTLAKRYVQLALRYPLATILAITFTNKASFEMKARILEFLKMISLDRFSSPEKRREIYEGFGLDEHSREQAAKVMEAIISDYNYFQVQTIDSFINAILSGCSFKLGLAANFRTERDFRVYVRQALDRLVDKAGKDEQVRELFDDFLRQYLYLEKNTGWFAHETIARIMEELFFTGSYYAVPFAQTKVKSEWLISQKKELFGLLQELHAALPEQTHKIFAKGLEKFLREHALSFGVEDLSNYYSWEEFPITKGTPVPAPVRRLWGQIRSSIITYCRQESFSSYNTYIAIFRRVQEELSLLARKDNVLFLEALNKHARVLFDEQSLELPELYYRLARRFRHFLVDEFQDTSMLQWLNLEPMAAEALSGEGSLFFVGDRKQAIYRFRGGDASLIDTVRSRFSHLEHIQETLSVNYRSAEEVVRFNNEIFSPANLSRFLQWFAGEERKGIMLRPQDAQEIAGGFSASLQEALPQHSGGLVRVREVLSDGQEEYQEALRAALVELVTKDLLSRRQLRDVTFVVRTNAQVEAVTSWLLEAGIPVASEKTLDIRQHPLIKELVSLLRFLNSPVDDVSFAAFITGKLFTSCAGVKAEEVHGFLVSRLAVPNERAGERTGEGSLYRLFRDRFPALWEEWVEGFFKSVGFVPLYELTVSMVQKFGCLKRFPDDQGFVMRLLELIKEQEEQYPSITDFLEFFSCAQDELMFVSAAESDAVKVMTIHKAKGLEFPVVVAPFLAFDAVPAAGDAVTVAGETSLMRVRFKKKYAVFCEEFKQMGADDLAAAVKDELNAIYVACTRAARELHVVLGPGKAGQAIRELIPSALWDRGSEEAERAAARKDAGAARSREVQELAPGSYRDWIEVLKGEFPMASELRRRPQIEHGNVLHGIMGALKHVPEGARASEVERAIREVKPRFPWFTEWQKARDSVEALLSQRGMRAFFEDAQARVFTEYELTDASGATFRIDRLVVSSGGQGPQAAVIDYKSTSFGADEYRQQVRNYLRLAAGRYPGHSVKGYLVFFDTLTMEEVG